MNINRIITAVAAAVVAVCLNAQTTMTLTGRQQALVGIAANEAKMPEARWSESCQRVHTVRPECATITG